jgi:hypothetical protein
MKNKSEPPTKFEHNKGEYKYASGAENRYREYKIIKNEDIKYYGSKEIRVRNIVRKLK